MTVRVKVNRAAIRALLKSPEVADDLDRRARRIASAAGTGFEVDSRIGSNRARSSVRTETFEARRAEATGRSLTRAIDAGRN